MKISIYQKKEPLLIEKILRTSIIKADVIEKTICEEIVNQPLLSSSVYRPLSDKKDNCKTERTK